MEIKKTWRFICLGFDLFCLVKGTVYPETVKSCEMKASISKLRGESFFRAKQTSKHFQEIALKIFFEIFKNTSSRLQESLKRLSVSAREFRSIKFHPSSLSPGYL
jgi:hypothetical protein